MLPFLPSGFFHPPRPGKGELFESEEAKVVEGCWPKPRGRRERGVWRRPRSSTEEEARVEIEFDEVPRMEADPLIDAEGRTHGDQGTVPSTESSGR
jgi:hypothetical protein